MSDISQREMMDDEIDLRELFGLFYTRKLTIVLVTFLATLIGVAYALITTPVYQADALVQLEEKSGGMAISSDLSDLLGSTAPVSVAEIEIIKSRMVLGVVADDLNLDWSAEPKRLPVIGNFLTRYDLPDPAFAWISSYAWHDEEILIGRLEVPEYLLDEPLVLINLGSGAYEIEVDGRWISGTVGQTVKEDALGFALLVDVLKGQAGREYIVTQLSFAEVMESLRENLSISEKGKKSSILQMTMKGEDPAAAAAILDQILDVYLLQNLARNAAEAESSLTFIRQQLPQTQEQVRLAEVALNDFKASQDSIDLSFETRAVLEQGIEIEAQLNALALEEQELQKRFTQSHPVYQTLLDNRAQLNLRLSEIRNETDDLPQTQQEMLRLSLDLEVAQEIYLQMVNRAQELNVLKAGTIGNIRIIDTALSAPKAIEPNKKMIVLLAAVLGGMIGVGFVLLRSFMARGVQSVEEIEALGISVYATVPKTGRGDFNGSKKRKDSLDVLALSDPTNLSVEALRSLRTSLHFGMLDAKSSLCMVTSSRPGDGKSFLSVNLSVVLAQAGQNICLVDADIRRGHLNRHFGVSRDTPGLTDVLAGDAMIEDVILKDEDSGLYFIPTGKYPPNPSELLMHKRFGEVADYLDKRFDLTILDTPPLLAVTDPAIIGKYAGMILLSVRHEATNIGEIKAAQKVIDTNGLKITGAILNGYNVKKAGAGGMSYHYEYKARRD